MTQQVPCVAILERVLGMEEQCTVKLDKQTRRIALTSRIWVGAGEGHFASHAATSGSHNALSTSNFSVDKGFVVVASADGIPMPKILAV